MESLLKVNQNSNNTITSMELVDIINEFRRIEKSNYSELQHSDFIKKIRKEIESLKNAGIEPEGNFSLGSYTDKQNQQRVCYYLNRNGMLQMLNSESSYVRCKTIEYIEKLENTLNNTLTPHENYMAQVEETKGDIELINMVSKTLNINDNSKLGLIHKSFENHGINTNLLPVYTPSNGILKSVTELLKDNNINMSAKKFNKILIEKGILKENERKSSKGGVKKFKTLVKEYYGENQVSPKNPKETQPMYYVDKFGELLKEVGVV